MEPTLLKSAATLCKTIMRNGYDAYVVSTALQAELVKSLGEKELDIACDAPEEELLRLFPSLEHCSEPGVIALLKEGDITYRFYPTAQSASSPPQMALCRMTPHILKRMARLGPLPASLHNPLSPAVASENGGFADFSVKCVRLEGLPDETLWRNHILGIRAMRYAANLDLPIDPPTWIAIVRAVPRILDYTPARDIMDEWRKVQPDKMWRFVTYLIDSQVIHGLIPEVASLGLIRQTTADGSEENVLEHTLACMKEYPKDTFAYDWLGTFAMLFHDVGKILTAEYFHGAWTFFQHHQAGAKLTRQILRRLHMTTEETDSICHLVLHHMRFHFMMTDKGIRRFTALDDTARLIQMARADAAAHEDNFTAFNHNIKYLDRAQTPEAMLEPFLNGNEIMEYTGLTPGPDVGAARDALLQAQIEGRVGNTGEAVIFVKNFVKERR